MAPKRTKNVPPRAVDEASLEQLSDAELGELETLLRARTDAGGP